MICGEKFYALHYMLIVYLIFLYVGLDKFFKTCPEAGFNINEYGKQIKKWTLRLYSMEKAGDITSKQT